MTRIFAFLLVLMAAFTAIASVTNSYPVIEWGSIGTGFTSNGWQVAGVENYGSSYHNALKLKDQTCFIQSPVSTNVITEVKVRVVSMSIGDRRLLITPLRGGTPLTEHEVKCECSPTKNIFIDQAAVWPSSLRIRSFLLHLSDGSSPTWGIWKLTVVYESLPPGMLIVIR